MSAGNIYGLGAYLESGDAVQHFNGRIWRRVDLPSSIGFERSVLAVTSRDVWVTGETTNSPEIKPTLVQWNGSSWKRVGVTAPPTANLLYGITPDGSGGIWIEAQASTSGRSWICTGRPRAGGPRRRFRSAAAWVPTATR